MAVRVSLEGGASCRVDGHVGVVSERVGDADKVAGVVVGVGGGVLAGGVRGDVSARIYFCNLPVVVVVAPHRLAAPGGCRRGAVADLVVGERGAVVRRRRTGRVATWACDPLQASGVVVAVGGGVSQRVGLAGGVARLVIGGVGRVIEWVGDRDRPVGDVVVGDRHGVRRVGDLGEVAVCVIGVVPRVGLRRRAREVAAWQCLAGQPIRQVVRVAGHITGRGGLSRDVTHIVIRGRRGSDRCRNRRRPVVLVIANRGGLPPRVGGRGAVAGRVVPVAGRVAEGIGDRQDLIRVGVADQSAVLVRIPTRRVTPRIDHPPQPAGLVIPPRRGLPQRRRDRREVSVGVIPVRGGLPPGVCDGGELAACVVRVRGDLAERISHRLDAIQRVVDVRRGLATRISDRLQVPVRVIRAGLDRRHRRRPRDLRDVAGGVVLLHHRVATRIRRPGAVQVGVVGVADDASQRVAPRLQYPVLIHLLPHATVRIGHRRRLRRRVP